MQEQGKVVNENYGLSKGARVDYHICDAGSAFRFGSLHAVGIVNIIKKMEGERCWENREGVGDGGKTMPQR